MVPPCSAAGGAADAAAPLGAGVHHYVARDHRLEQRAAYAAAGAPIGAEAAAAPGFAVALTSIHWREAWKYGERALRYCQHDVGHALAALRLSAATLGWRALLVDELGDAALRRLLGLDRESELAHLVAAERDAPETLLWIATDGLLPDRAAVQRRLDDCMAATATARFAGRPSVLSPDHVDWPVIELAARATERPAGATAECASVGAAAPARALPDGVAARPALELIRQRRSAVAFDGRTALPAADFFALLELLLPRAACSPWDAWPAAPRVSLLLFVHRVDGIGPGLYLLERGADAAARAELRAACTAPLEWAAVVEAPAHLPLVRLRDGDWRDTAQLISCRQEIAADGAFALAMVARFEPEVRAAAWRWRRLFWECGFVGQLLYLGAEAVGVRATGIGCFYDDLVHELLGLRDATFQSLYHFTVGTPVEDARLQTEPAYGPDVLARPS